MCRNAGRVSLGGSNFIFRIIINELTSSECEETAVLCLRTRAESSQSRRLRLGTPTPQCTWTVGTSGDVFVEEPSNWGHISQKIQSSSLLRQWDLSVFSSSQVESWVVAVVYWSVSPASERAQSSPPLPARATLPAWRSWRVWEAPPRQRWPDWLRDSRSGHAVSHLHPRPSPPLFLHDIIITTMIM